MTAMRMLMLAVLVAGGGLDCALQAFRQQRTRQQIHELGRDIALQRDRIDHGRLEFQQEVVGELYGPDGRELSLDPVQPSIVPGLALDRGEAGNGI